MKKTRLLLLLALLMTAATGAWAQDAKHLITATYDEQTRSLEQPLPYATTVGELYEAVTGQSFSDLLSTMTALETPLSGIGSTNTSVVSIGELNGASTPVTVNADGKAAVALRFGSYAQGIFVSVTPPLYVTMKDGTEDADKWTVTVGTSTTAQTLPVGGLNEGDAVTMKYNGRLKVKSVTATTDAAPAPAPAGITAARAAYQGTNAPSQNWTKGDKLYVYGPGLELMGTLVADADGAEVLMAGTLDFTKTGTTAPMRLTLSNLPLPMDYSTHDGQLSTVQSKMNYAMATATATAIDAEAGTVTLDAKPTLQPQQALVKLMLQNTGGTAISPSSLTVNLDASGGYSTITLLRFDVSNEGAGDWIYGGATYENGIITLPKAGGCGCGWKPALWEGVDLTKYTGATCTFAQPVSGNCLFFVAYKKAGSEDQMYSPSSTVSDGATHAWVGIPSDATEILGIYFALIDATQSDVKLYPSDLRLSKIGGFTLSPNASEVYIPFKGTEPGSTLRLDATVSGTSYSSSTTGINFAEGSYYEETVNMTVKAGN